MFPARGAPGGAARARAACPTGGHQFPPVRQQGGSRPRRRARAVAPPCACPPPRRPRSAHCRCPVRRLPCPTPSGACDLLRMQQHVRQDTLPAAAAPDTLTSANRRAVPAALVSRHEQDRSSSAAAMSRAAPGGREAVPLRAHALRLLLLGVVLLGLHVGAARGDDDAQRGMRFTSAMQVGGRGRRAPRVSAWRAARAGGAAPVITLHSQMAQQR